MVQRPPDTPASEISEWTVGAAALDGSLVASGKQVPSAAAIGREARALSAPPASLRRWRIRYRLASGAIDVVAALAGPTIAYVVDPRLHAGRAGSLWPYLLLLFSFAAVWLACVEFNRGYDVRFQTSGAFEFARVGRASVQLAAITSLVVFFAHASIPRSLVVLTLLSTFVVSFAGRIAGRAVIRRCRRSGSARTAILAVGSPGEVAQFSDTLMANASTGMFVVAACLSDATLPDAEGDALGAELARRSIHVGGTIDAIRDAAVASGAGAVAVVSKSIPGEVLRWISWQLEGNDIDLIVVPGMTEVAGRRLDIHQVGGLPLVYVAEPELTGVRRLIKSTFDRVIAALALVLLSPVLLAIAVTVRVTSAGPMFYKQVRVGKGGRTFRIIKYRSMHVDADRLIMTLHHANEIDGGTLFKIRRDPRVTRVGRFLRRYSLDELPQLINVLTGSMSLVGPRPPLRDEVATYEGAVHRRLLVKPGMTGLWQISGRSDLSWEESVHLDLRYVDTWSLMLDLTVLIRTVSAVVRGRGAY